MPERLQNIVSRQTVLAYAQGAAQNMLQNSVGSFIAPPVNVPTAVGYFKKYTEKSRYRIPNTKRNPGERAVRIGWDAKDGTYNCQPNALDVPLDISEIESVEQGELLLRDAADLAAEIAALAYESDVIKKALEAAPNSNADWAAADSNPISDMDDIVLDVMRATGLGGSLGVRMVLGGEAWKVAKNHPKLLAKIMDNNKRAQVPTLPDFNDLVIGSPLSRVTYSLEDVAPEGKAAKLQFLLSDKILIFVANSNPTRRDPSFMKTFRKAGEWMRPGTYQSEDGRGEIAKMDWSEDVQVTNGVACKCITVGK